MTYYPVFAAGMLAIPILIKEIRGSKSARINFIVVTICIACALLWRTQTQSTVIPRYTTIFCYLFHGLAAYFIITVLNTPLTFAHTQKYKCVYISLKILVVLLIAIIPTIKNTKINKYDTRIINAAETLSVLTRSENPDIYYLANDKEHYRLAYYSNIDVQNIKLIPSGIFFQKIDDDKYTELILNGWRIPGKNYLIYYTSRKPQNNVQEHHKYNKRIVLSHFSTDKKNKRIVIYEVSGNSPLISKDKHISDRNINNLCINGDFEKLQKESEQLVSKRLLPIIWNFSLQQDYDPFQVEKDFPLNGSNSLRITSSYDNTPFFYSNSFSCNGNLLLTASIQGEGKTNPILQVVFYSKTNSIIEEKEIDVIRVPSNDLYTLKLQTTSFHGTNHSVSALFAVDGSIVIDDIAITELEETL